MRGEQSERFAQTREEGEAKSFAFWFVLNYAAMNTIRILSHAAALGLAAFALAASAPRAFAFSAAFHWCAGSPGFELKDVPAGTAKLQFHMTDLNVPGFHHGGGTVAFSGQAAVPCGAFAAGFTGPSPPPGQIHTYQFSIKALSADGKVLATTTAQRKFPER